jgi:hypothetical protein
VSVRDHHEQLTERQTGFQDTGTYEEHQATNSRTAIPAKALQSQPDACPCQRLLATNVLAHIHAQSFDHAQGR